MPANVSDAQALTILRESQNKAFDAAGKAESAAAGSMHAAKARQLHDTIKQAHGEQMDSLTKFGSGALGNLMNFKAATHANTKPNIRQMKAEADAAYQARIAKDTASRAGLSAVASSGGIAQMVDKAHDAVSQGFGGQAQVHEAQVDSKLAEMAETVAKQRMEGAKAHKEQASKALDANNEAVKGVYERAKQVMDRAFGG